MVCTSRPTACKSVCSSPGEAERKSVAASSTVGYVVSGLTHGSLLPGFASGLIFMVVTMLVLRQRNKQKDAA